MIRINDDNRARLVSLAISGALGFVSNRLPSDVEELSFFGGLGVVVAVSFAVIAMIVYRYILCPRMSDAKPLLAIVAVGAFLVVVVVGIVYWTSAYNRTFEFEGERYIAGSWFTKKVEDKQVGDNIVFKDAVGNEVSIDASDHRRVVLEAGATAKNYFRSVWPKAATDDATKRLLWKYLAVTAAIGLLFGCAIELLLVGSTCRH